jgi:hypothetical protein
MADNRLEPLVLAGDERRTLENWVRRRSTAQGLALRARIVLACAQGVLPAIRYEHDGVIPGEHAESGIPGV